MGRYLDREELLGDLRQPLRLDVCGGVHELLGGHDELVVDDVVGEGAHAVQRGRGVQVTGNACHTHGAGVCARDPSPAPGVPETRHPRIRTKAKQSGGSRRRVSGNRRRLEGNRR